MGLASDWESHCSPHHPDPRGRTTQVGGAASRLSPKINPHQLREPVPYKHLERGMEPDT